MNIATAAVNLGLAIAAVMRKRRICILLQKGPEAMANSNSRTCFRAPGAYRAPPCACAISTAGKVTVKNDDTCPIKSAACCRTCFICSTDSSA